jgi:hypothetical protein
MRCVVRGSWWVERCVGRRDDKSCLRKAPANTMRGGSTVVDSNEW